VSMVPGHMHCRVHTCSIKQVSLLAKLVQPLQSTSLHTAVKSLPHTIIMGDSPHANARRRAMRGHLIAKGLAWLGGAAFILLLLSASGMLGLLSAGAGGGGRGGTPLADSNSQAIHEEYVRDLRIQDAGEVRRYGTVHSQ
jgi:hypothetical protein